MHEKALMDDLINKLESTAHAVGGRRVVRIRVRLGALSHFTAEHFREHFDDASRGTIAEGAAVEAEVGEDPTDADAQSVVLEEVELSVQDASG